MTTQVIGGAVRALLAAIGGNLFFSDNEVSQIAGALSVLATIGWSAYQKYSSEKAKTQ